MRLVERLRVRRADRRARAAERAEEQARLRRELEADDRSVAASTHPPVPPGSPFGGPC